MAEVSNFLFVDALKQLSQEIALAGIAAMNLTKAYQQIDFMWM